MRSKIKKLVFWGWVFFIPFVVPNLLAAQTVIDQSFTSPTTGLALYGDYAFIAQTFTAGLTGALAGVNINVNSSSPFPLQVAIHTVTSSGEPSSTILGNTTLTQSSAPLSLLITFPQTINMIAGVQYAIVVNFEGAPPNRPEGVWYGAGGNYYTGGEAYASIDGSSWLAGEDFDLHFQTYVTVNNNPDCSDAYASCEGYESNCLSPSNHQMVPVHILGVTDPDGDPVTIIVNTITSDEPTATAKGAGGSKYAPDADGAGTDTAIVRAERSANGDGRVYVINFTANDGQGGLCPGSVVVLVPKGTSKTTDCPAVDNGQKYDATKIN